MGKDWQTIAFPLVGGVETKVDGIALSPPRLELCEDAFVDKSGTLRKRKGFAALPQTDLSGNTVMATAGGVKHLASYRSGLLAFTPTKAFEYSGQFERWIDKGTAYSAQLRARDIQHSASGFVVEADHAVANGYVVYAMEDTTSPSASALRIVIVDSTSGALVTNFAVDSNGYMPKVIARDALVYVFWYDPDGTAAIRVKIIDTTSAATLAASISATSVSVVTNMAVVSSMPIYDVASNSTYGILLAYRTTTANQIAWGFVDTSGVYGSGSTAATTGNAVAIGCAVEPTVRAVHGIVYVNGATGAAHSDVYALLRSWSGAAWTSTATSTAMENATLNDGAMDRVTCAFDSTTVLRVWYAGDRATTTSTDHVVKTHQGTFDTAGVITPRTHTLWKMGLASKPFSYRSEWYGTVLVSDPLNSIQPTTFVVRLTDGAVVARLSENAWWTLRCHNLGHWTSDASGNAAFRHAGMFRRTGPLNFGTLVPLSFGPGLRSFSLDFEPTHGWQTAEAGDALYLAGALQMQYAGDDQFVESGFLRIVESSTLVATPSNTGPGLMTPAVEYAYHVIPEWVSAAGEREYGTNSGPITVTMGGADDTVTISIPTITTTYKISSKSPVVFGVYRTLANPGPDATYYRVGQVANSTIVNEVTYVDERADTDIDEEEIFYQVSGELDNTPSPAGSVMSAGSSRLYVADAVNKGLVWASKLREAGAPVEWSDALQIQVPDWSGVVTALAVLNESLVVFTERAIYRVTGEGPSNTGATGEWFPAQLVSSDTGAIGQRGVCVTPMGVTFQARKGLYLLDGGFQPSYFGSSIEGLSPGTIVSALVVPGEQQVRFGSSAGVFVYDYFHKIWSRYTRGAVGQAAIYANRVVNLFSSSQMDWEDSTGATIYDTGNWRAKLAWVRPPQQMQADMRIRTIGVVGKASGGTVNLRLKLYKDGSSTLFQTITDTPSTSVTHFREQYALDTQIMSMLQVEIDDNGTASPAALEIHELQFEVRPRSGALNRRTPS